MKDTRARVPELRADVQGLIRIVETARTLDEETKKRFVAQLGEIAKLSSAGKIVASIPLIPGLLSYVTESGVSIDWNKWLQRVRSLFTRKDKALVEINGEQMTRG